MEEIEAENRANVSWGHETRRRFEFTYALMDNHNNWGSIAEKTILNCFSKEVLVNTILGRPSDEINIGNLFEIIDAKWDKRQGKG